jgi:hypothetical protein
VVIGLSYRLPFNYRSIIKQEVSVHTLFSTVGRLNENVAPLLQGVIFGPDSTIVSLDNTF